jgi:hypothetical protein
MYRPTEIPHVTKIEKKAGNDKVVMEKVAAMVEMFEFMLKGEDVR